MLWSLIFDGELPAQQLAVVTPSSATNWGKLRADAERIAQGYAGFGRRRVGLSFPPAAISYAAVAALDRLSCDTFLLDSQAPLAEQLRLSQRLKLDALFVPAADGRSVAFEVHELAERSSVERHSDGNHTHVRDDRRAESSPAQLGKPFPTGTEKGGYFFPAVASDLSPQSLRGPSGHAPMLCRSRHIGDDRDVTRSEFHRSFYV